MYYTYVIECSDKSLYTGYTTNIEERLRKHNGIIPGGAKYTTSRRPVRLVFVQEYASKSEAMQSEAFIKSLSRKAKLELINSA
jgi:putative endonuclease